MAGLEETKKLMEQITASLEEVDQLVSRGQAVNPYTLATITRKVDQLLAWMSPVAGSARKRDRSNLLQIFETLHELVSEAEREIAGQTDFEAQLEDHRQRLQRRAKAAHRRNLLSASDLARLEERAEEVVSDWKASANRHAAFKAMTALDESLEQTTHEAIRGPSATRKGFIRG